MYVHRTCGLALIVALVVGCNGTQDDVTEPQSQQPDTLAKTSSTPPKPEVEPDTEPVTVLPEDLPTPVELVDVDWPQYRGQQRNGISHDTGLMRSWAEPGPEVLWETAVGQGYSAPSVVADRVYLNDYDEEKNQWMVRCLQLDTGDELWRYKVDKRIRPNHGITRSAPATDGGFVFSIDPKCELHCLDARNGALIWKKFLPKEYDSLIPAWYNGQCPLIDQDQLVIATGGKILLTALEKSTGKPIWETANEDEFLLTHSSIMPVEIDGVQQYTYNTMTGLVGVAADTGKLLWHFPWKFNTAVGTTPLPLGDGKFFLTSGYHAQTVACQVTREGDAWSAKEVFNLPPPTTGWNSEVHTPIFYRDHIYGVGKKQRGLWTCLDLDGNEVWTSKGEASFGMGGYVLAEGLFFVLEGKTGTLRVLDANADQYAELASVTLLEGPDVWTPPIISHGKLLIRDLGKLICLKISADESQPKVAIKE